MGLWINHKCVSVLVCVCVFRGVAGVCPLCTPTAATRLATCSGIREHADYTRHNGHTQTQICPWPTKDTHTHTHTHRTASALIAFSIFNIFIVWEIMTLDAAHNTAADVHVCVDWCCSVQEERFWAVLIFGCAYCTIHKLYEWVWTCVSACVCCGGVLLATPCDPQQICCPTFQL